MCPPLIWASARVQFPLSKCFMLYIVLAGRQTNTICTLSFNWNHFEMKLLNLRINFYLLRTFPPHLGSFMCCFFFYYVSAKFHLWPSSGDLPRPRIGMLSLVTVSPVITAFHSCCLSHHVFDQVNLSTVPGEHCQKIAVSNPTQAGQRFTWWGQKVRNK